MTTINATARRPQPLRLGSLPPGERQGATARRPAMEDIEYEGNRAAFLQSWIRGRA